MQDRAIARIQRRQYGLITSQQLERHGMTRDGRRRSLASGKVDRFRRGVYAAPAVAPNYEQSVWAALLAGGETAFASHMTAAWLWHLPTEFREGPPIELTVVLERHPRLDGVIVHRSGLVVERDITRLKGMPVSTPERLIVDCSSRLSIMQLGELADDAVRRRITTTWRISRLADRLRPAPGRSLSKVREMLERRIPGVHERESVLEDFVLDALRSYGLPLPRAQYWVRLRGRRRRIDLCFPEDALALEALGFETHRMRSHFDDDALRGNELQLAGFRVLEFTSAFSTRMIAEQVAHALGRDLACEGVDLTFEQWRQAR